MLESFMIFIYLKLITKLYNIKNLKSCPQSNGLVNFWPENEKREGTDLGVWSFEQGELFD